MPLLKIALYSIYWPYNSTWCVFHPNIYYLSSVWTTSEIQREFNRYCFVGHFACNLRIKISWTQAYFPFFLRLRYSHPCMLFSRLLCLYLVCLEIVTPALSRSSWASFPFSDLRLAALAIYCASIRLMWSSQSCFLFKTHLLIFSLYMFSLYLHMIFPGGFPLCMTKDLHFIYCCNIWSATNSLHQIGGLDDVIHLF